MVPFSHTLALAKSIAHAIYWGAEGLGEGYVKITLIVSCLEPDGGGGGYSLTRA